MTCRKTGSYLKISCSPRPSSMAGGWKMNERRTLLSPSIHDNKSHEGSAFLGYPLHTSSYLHACETIELISYLGWFGSPGDLPSSYPSKGRGVHVGTSSTRLGWNVRKNLVQRTGPSLSPEPRVSDLRPEDRNLRSKEHVSNIKGRSGKHSQ